MTRHLPVLIASAFLAVGCAANNPTASEDIVRDKSVENRIRSGETLKDKREAEDRAIDRQASKGANSSYGYSGGTGGSRKRAAPTRANEDLDGTDTDTTTKTSTDRLAGLLGASSGSGWTQYMGLLFAGLAMNAGELMKAGGKGVDGIGALLGGKTDSEKDSKEKTDKPENLRVAIGQRDAGTSAERSDPGQAVSGPVNPEAPKSSEDLSKLLKISLNKKEVSEKPGGAEGAKYATPILSGAKAPEATSAVAAPAAQVVAEKPTGIRVTFIPKGAPLEVEQPKAAVLPRELPTVVSDTPNIECVLPNENIDPDLVKAFFAMKGGS